jgi:ERCC4-type nuclease
MNENLILEIDYREHGLIKLFNESLKTQLKDNNTSLLISNLVIGDIIIKNEKGIIFIIERKTFTDLSASICDNRFREQKQRLIDSVCDPNKIIYLLEGNKKIIKNLSKTIIDSSVLNLIFRHHYNIIFTQDLQDTLDNILLLCKKVRTGEFNKNLNDIGPLKLIKKSDKLSNNIFINQLQQIPGVSSDIANAIKNKYKNMNELILAFNTNLKEKLLVGLPITESRKIGLITSKKIYEALF